MKIMMLLIGHDFPPDIRVEKEARALLTAGHHVTVVCENRKNRSPQEDWNGVQIVRLPRLSPWSRRLNRARLLITHRSPLWEREITELVQEESPDALHVHDLPFVGPGLRIARQFNLPLVADLHENYPALVQVRHTGGNYNPIDRFVFDPQRFARYERRVLPHCDYVIVVVEEAAQRIMDLGVSAEKITVVGNTEDIDTVSAVDEQDVRLPPSDMTLLYVGGFGPHRGLEVVIRAMPKILEYIPSAVFVIVGDGAGRSSLERLAHRVGVAQSVQFEGRQPFDRVHSYIRASDVCLVPHIANPHTNATMPHKLFQYMYMNKPVIVSSATPLVRVVQESNAGLVFESGNPEALASCVLELQDQAMRRALGDSGHNAVVRHYNWRHDARKLVDLYRIPEGK
jgi:glycosyltransferase involved in cell wall biosynthesis